MGKQYCNMSVLMQIYTNFEVFGDKCVALIVALKFVDFEVGLLFPHMKQNYNHCRDFINNFPSLCLVDFVFGAKERVIVVV